MYHNHTYADVNEALPDLLLRLERDGEEVGSRVGRTHELTHVGITLTDPVNREILLPARKANIAAQIAETMWVLSGRADIGWLEHYLPRVRDFSDDGETWRAGYGARLRHWERRTTATGFHGPDVDQIAWVFEHLRSQPASRRAVLSIWDPSIDTEDAKDIPCNDWLNFSSRLGKLDLHVAIRSNDVIWGWSGINQFEWSVLLEVMAGLLGLEVGSLHFSTTSFHIYDHHWSKSVKIRDHAYRVTGIAPSPRFDASTLRTKDMAGFDEVMRGWFRLEEDIRSGNMRESDVDAFPEPMLRSWLRVLQWWWSGETEYLSGLEGTRLERATTYAVQPPERVLPTFDAAPGRLFAVGDDEFIEGLCRLHLQKEAAYGGSWKKRGELFSILPNVGRKVDRLGTGGVTDDETSADTAGDLFVYLAKYVTWLNDHYSIDGPDDSDDAKSANEVMRTVHQQTHGLSVPGVKDLVDHLIDLYDEVLPLAEAKDPRRVDLVNEMLAPAYMLARTLWERESRSESLDEYRGADAD